MSMVIIIITFDGSNTGTVCTFAGQGSANVDANKIQEMQKNNKLLFDIFIYTLKVRAWYLNEKDIFLAKQSHYY